VHAFPSSQTFGVLRHWPLDGSHTSSVHGLPSSQEIGVWLHSPVVVSHESVVQRSPSLQLTGVPLWHSPVAASHVSTPLQALPSLQSASVLQQPAIDWCWQPSDASQLSVVHVIPSSQLTVS
jgi:hypothetical protein